MIIDVIEYRRISLRFRRTVSETVPRMKDAEVIDVLDIAFLEIEAQRILFGEEVKRIQRFALSFCNWGDVR